MSPNEMAGSSGQRAGNAGVRPVTDTAGATGLKPSPGPPQSEDQIRVSRACTLSVCLCGENKTIDYPFCFNCFTRLEPTLQYALTCKSKKKVYIGTYYAAALKLGGHI
jgi:hypothetical protein